MKLKFLVFLRYPISYPFIQFGIWFFFTEKLSIFLVEDAQVYQFFFGEFQRKFIIITQIVVSFTSSDAVVKIWVEIILSLSSFFLCNVLEMLNVCDFNFVLKYLVKSLLLMCDFWSKTSLNLAISRIKLLQNKRDLQLKNMRKEIAQFLQAGQEAIARIRVDLQYCKCVQLGFFFFFALWILWIILGVYLMIWLGGACYTRTKHMGCIWDIRALLWIYSCTRSHYWKPEVNLLITGILFFIGEFILLSASCNSNLKASIGLQTLG